jgi:hypothetical protein
MLYVCLYVCGQTTALLVEEDGAEAAASTADVLLVIDSKQEECAGTGSHAMLAQAPALGIPFLPPPGVQLFLVSRQGHELLQLSAAQQLLVLTVEGQPFLQCGEWLCPLMEVWRCSISARLATAVCAPALCGLGWTGHALPVPTAPFLRLCRWQVSATGLQLIPPTPLGLKQ